MKRVTLPLLVLLFAGCKTLYNYSPPAPNNTFYANPGEVHLIGDLGGSNVAFLNAKGGVAITKNFSVIGTYGGGIAKAYHSNEGEAALGYQTDFSKGLCFSVYAGSGFGSNYNQDSGAAYHGVAYKNFYGNFNKPFLQLSVGSAGRHFEETFTLKFDYMNYSGFMYAGNGAYSGFSPGTFFYEPYISGSAGGEHFRLEYGTGFALKNISEWGKGFRIFPWQFNIGFYILLNRKGEEAAK